jgi:hypothetical protein
MALWYGELKSFYILNVREFSFPEYGDVFVIHGRPASR